MERIPSLIFGRDFHWAKLQLGMDSKKKKKERKKRNGFHLSLSRPETFFLVLSHLLAIFLFIHIFTNLVSRERKGHLMIH